MQYNVGQILYVLMRKEKTVIPVRIVEQVLKTTLDGETTSYTVELPTNGNEKVPLEKLGSGVYTSSNEVMTAMFSNAETLIRKIVKKSEDIALASFGVASKAPESITKVNNISESATNSIDINDIEVDLGDGVKGKVLMGTFE